MRQQGKDSSQRQPGLRRGRRTVVLCQRQGPKGGSEQGTRRGCLRTPSQGETEEASDRGQSGDERGGRILAEVVQNPALRVHDVHVQDPKVGEALDVHAPAWAEGTREPVRRSG